MINKDLFFLIFNLSGQNPIIDQLMIFGTNELIYLTFLFVLLLAVKGGIKEKKSFLLIILSLPIAVLIIKGVHLFVYEPRPFVTFNLTPLVSETLNAAFPSRHATISAVIAFAFIYFKSKYTLPLLLVMVWISISRVYVGVHYPLDLIGGWATAVISLTIALQIKKILKIGFLRA
ncbi:phosphatase PAP2 family protein [Candidatus Daviesbacteria bacterium]|nr:phosphatase PAP2 family protein [Candidatus Daviesbacteria bacterium]